MKGRMINLHDNLPISYNSLDPILLFKVWQCLTKMSLHKKHSVNGDIGLNDINHIEPYDIDTACVISSIGVLK